MIRHFLSSSPYGNGADARTGPPLRPVVAARRTDGRPRQPLEASQALDSSSLLKLCWDFVNFGRPYLPNRLADFDEISRGDALGHGLPAVKISGSADDVFPPLDKKRNGSSKTRK